MPLRYLLYFKLKLACDGWYIFTNLKEAISFVFCSSTNVINAVQSRLKVNICFGINFGLRKGTKMAK